MTKTVRKPRGPSAQNVRIYTSLEKLVNEQNDVFTKSEIAKKIVGINKPVFNFAFNKLLDAGVIEFCGTVPQDGRGRPENVYYRV